MVYLIEIMYVLDLNINNFFSKIKLKIETNFFKFFSNLRFVLGGIPNVRHNQ